MSALTAEQRRYAASPAHFCSSFVLVHAHAQTKITVSVTWSRPRTSSTSHRVYVHLLRWLRRHFCAYTARAVAHANKESPSQLFYSHAREQAYACWAGCCHWLMFGTRLLFSASDSSHLTLSVSVRRSFLLIPPTERRGTVFAAVTVAMVIGERASGSGSFSRS